MEVNAEFVDAVYEAVKAHEVYPDHFSGKTIVILLDNAPAHRQTEARVTEREDLELLRLGPYSPMCNPIEGDRGHAQRVHVYYPTQTVIFNVTGCFSVLKARIKASLALCRDEMLSFPKGEKTEGRMRLLERDGEHCMPCMDRRLVNKMARHCALSVAAAIRSEPMEYGT
ncbi:hypothetical protein PI124_g8449 [Phytophthora idaei]|nr:hypothetical protein PI125_g8089 [Phytophthora idaei]KAG3130331.1 hypothetical protein PI126_g20556 [Phytophthora idaei]KAG3246833.1 hypothetical protein PI124_g8449 [Phytophthora idaei]